MASAVSGLGSSNSSNGSSSSNSNSLGIAAPNEAMFLQLLVAQLKNQDPLSPTDSTQFVSQLAQFSELEQVMGIKSDIETYHTAAATAAAAAATTSSTANSSQTGSTANGTGSTNTKSVS